jgi:taurine dioxygenase
MAVRLSDVQVRPFDAALGAEVRCGDLRRASDAQFAQIRQAWLDHLVLVFRGQALSDEELLALGRRFGEPDDTVRPQPTDQPGQPSRQMALTVVSNVVEDGKPIGALSNVDLVWHTDMSYILVPPDASLLYAVEVPGFDPPTDVTRSPGPSHPAIRTHPETGCDALFLGRRPFSYVQGLAVAESEALLDQLWAHAARPEFAWYHTWSVGDVVIWDNRCTMHRRNAFDNDARRIMHRTQIKGTRPYRDAATYPKPAHGRVIGMAKQVNG